LVKIYFVKIAAENIKDLFQIYIFVLQGDCWWKYNHCQLELFSLWRKSPCCRKAI